MIAVQRADAGTLIKRCTHAIRIEQPPASNAQAREQSVTSLIDEPCPRQPGESCKLLSIEEFRCHGADPAHASAIVKS
jgi:hypothetical protein